MLDPGESVPFGVQINLVPDSGRGTLSDFQQQQGTETGTVTGSIESSANESVSQATVTASEDDRAFTYTVGSETGAYELELDAGEDTFAADASVSASVPGVHRRQRRRNDNRRLRLARRDRLPSTSPQR